MIIAAPEVILADAPQAFLPVLVCKPHGGNACVTFSGPAFGCACAGWCGPSRALGLRRRHSSWSLPTLAGCDPARLIHGLPGRSILRLIPWGLESLPESTPPSAGRLG